MLPDLLGDARVGPAVEVGHVLRIDRKPRRERKARGLGRLAETASSLVAAGRAASTPVAVIAHATRPTQRMVIGTLATIAAEVARAKLPAPALIVVGEVVAHAVAPAVVERLVALAG